MKTTFLNCRKEDRTAFRKEGRSHMEGRVEDFEFWREWGMDEDSVKQSLKHRLASESGTMNILDELEQHGDFHDYGLAVDYVVPGTFKNREGYLRYQLSYGGPSEEVRFYWSVGSREAYKIEFVYLNWGTGVGFNVTEEAWAKWLFEFFADAGTLDSAMKTAMNEA